MIGILLAAGRGRRMGGTKQLLPWRAADGTKPVVAAAFDAIAVVCNTIIVVLGHQAAAVSDALGRRPFHPVKSDPDADMFCSVRAGLRAAQHKNPRADILLQLGDHPEVRKQTLDALLELSATQPDRAVIPEYDGRGGHPILIPASLIGVVLGYDGPNGLRQFWATHPDRCFRIPVADPSVVLDLNTPDDLGTNGRSAQ